MKHLRAASMGMALALASSVNAASYEDTWVLLGLDIHMGAVTTRTFLDLPTPAHGEGLPTFPTKAACQRALTRTMAHYAGKRPCGRGFRSVSMHGLADLDDRAGLIAGDTDATFRAKHADAGDPIF
jgi:hypothetical protein